MDIHLHRVDNKTTIAQTKKSPGDKVDANGSQVGQSAPQESEASLKLTSLTASLEATPVVDDARVKIVSNALQSGHYQINAQKLADKIVAFEDGLP